MLFVLLPTQDFVDLAQDEDCPPAIQFRERDEEVKIATLSDPFNNSGLIRNIQNSDVHERCQDLLFQLRRHVKEHGFNLEFDKRILEKIYGDHREQRLREDLYDSYEIWQQTSQTPEEERLRDGYALPMECQRNFLQLIEKEIVRLRHLSCG